MSASFATPRHSVNLQSGPASVKETLPFSLHRPVQRLSLILASVNSEDAPKPNVGWLLQMLAHPMNRLILILALALAFALVSFPAQLAAQLVRENPPPQASSAQDSQDSSARHGQKRLSQEIQITGEEIWLDSGIDVQAGEHVVLTSTGKLRYADAKEDNGPEGLDRGFKDLLRMLPFNDAGRGALLGRIGDQDVAQTFLVGAKRDVLTPVPGRLSLGINQTTHATGDGTYVVRIEIYAPVDSFAHTGVKIFTSLPGIDKPLFSKIPRRIGDKDGNPGDMVNFLILGSE